MSEDILKKQQEEFKERVEELYHLNNKMSERIREFTAQQVELLQKNEQDLKSIQNNILTRLQGEAFLLEQVRQRIAQDMSLNRPKIYGLYLLYVVVLVAASMSIWVSYTDVTNQPGLLNDICLHMARGKVVVIDSKSISKEQVEGEELTTARIMK